MLGSPDASITVETVGDKPDAKRAADRTVDQLRRERREAEREAYLAKKLALCCTRCPAEPRSPATHGQYCEAHALEVHAIQRRSKRDVRRERRARGECALGCGRKSRTWECRFCQAIRGRLPSSSVPKATADQTVDPVQGVAARVEVDGYARERYHGKARRGAPSKEQADATDLLMAQASFSRAMQALALLAKERPTLPAQIYRQEREKALAQLGLCVRAIEEVLDRARFDTQAQVRELDRKRMLRDAGAK